MKSRKFKYETSVDVVAEVDTTVNATVDVPEDQILQWASEISSRAAVSGSQAKFDLESIYVALRKHGELALASRLRDIIDQGEIYGQ